jgi:DNA helicase-2/ATP-dependent DNA helicase PcrA
VGKDTSLKLNEEQLKAIKFGGGQFLIIAGAGTGKTTVVTERIKNLILSKKIKPDEILALTFTEKAAKEMEERVDIALPYGYTNMWIYTFHSFCDRILRAEALHIGLDPRYKLMTESESIQLLRNNLFKLNLNYFRPLGNPNKFLSGMLQHFSRLQDEDVDSKEYLKWVGRLKAKTVEEKEELKKYKELANAYREYEELKVREGRFDFGDLITKTLKLFRERKSVLASYRKQFKYILVDEFQDTNYAQNELVKLLTGKNGNITILADDNQSIYRFRGAAVSNVLQFNKTFPKTKIISLIKNYRSTQTILDSAYGLIKFNDPDTLEFQLGISKRLISVKKEKGEEVKFIHVDRVENEADEIAKEITKLIKEEKYNYSDFAILVRANNHSEPIIRALYRHGIPHQFLGPGRLFRQSEVVDLISYLKVLYNFEDSVSLYRILSMEYFEIAGRDLAAIGNFSKKYNLSLFEAIEKIDEIYVTDKTKETVKKMTDLIKKHLGLIRKETGGQLLYYFLAECGLLVKMLSPESVEAERRAKNISKFFDKLKSYEADHEDATVPALVDWLELSMELGESPLAADTDWTEINAVNILTVHSAKGLEFPVVFLVNLVSQRFPTTERREQIPIPEKLIKEVLPKGDYHEEEERRLFYVGMTRAKERLYLTAADYYGEGKRGKKLSPFIFEALEDKALSSEQGRDNTKQLSILEYKPGISIKEEKVPIHIDYLSYSQIETYKTCPLHYKLRFIYKVPTPQTASQSFGTTMHAVLKNFYLKVNEGEKPADKLIINLLSDLWVKEGYASKVQERKFLEKGKDYLRGFLKEEFNPKVKTVSLELPFIVPLISKDKKEKPLKIGGRIDRVDVFPGGSIEIIDYKTGATIPSQKDVDENLQLSFYALAATKIPTEPLGKLPDKIKLSLYYLDSQEKITTERTKGELDKAVDEIFKVRSDIEKSEFKCSNHMFCQNKCEYSLFCKSD